MCDIFMIHWSRVAVIDSVGWHGTERLRKIGEPSSGYLIRAYSVRAPVKFNAAAAAACPIFSSITEKYGDGIPLAVQIPMVLDADDFGFI